MFLILGFLTGLFVARNLKKRLEKGEIDWDRCKKVRLRGIVVFLGIGIIAGLIGYYSFATNVSLLNLFFGVELNLTFEALLLFLAVLFGMVFLGVGLALLIYRIKKPQ